MECALTRGSLTVVTLEVITSFGGVYTLHAHNRCYTTLQYRTSSEQRASIQVLCKYC